VFSAKTIRRLTAFVLLAIFACFAPSLFALGVVPNETPLLETVEAFDQTKLSSNAFTQTDDLRVIANHLDIPSTFVLAATSGDYELWVEPGNYSIRVRNIATGYIYGSSFAAAGVDIPYFNRTFELRVNSAVGIEYYQYDETSGVYLIKEEYILESNLTTTTYRDVENGFEADIVFGLSSVALTLRVTLADGELVIEVPNESISDTADYPLRSVRVYPYFGATYADSNPGYILVPDGAGALIRYRPIDAVTDVYQWNYYMSDIGIRAPVQGEADLTLPVFGMILGIRQNGFVGIIENGAEHATLVVNPAKSNLRYYMAYPQFVYRSLYAAPTSQAAAQSNSGRQVVQTDRIPFDLKVAYRFLSGDQADYVGMARSYRDHLIDEGVLSPKTEEAGSLSTMIEFIGGETTRGFLFDTIVTATTYAAAIDMVDELAPSLDVIHAVYKGVLAGGFSGAGPRTRQLLSRLGTLGELKTLKERLEASGGSLSLYADPLLAFGGRGYNPYSDQAQRINSRLLSGFGLLQDTAWMSVIPAMDLLQGNAAHFADLGFANLALGSIGHTLYSDYKNGEISRFEAAAVFRETLRDLDGELSLYRPNAYLFEAVSRYFSAPLVNSRFVIYTDTVPFLQIALSGTMDVYGGYLNFAADRAGTLLGLMDFGVYPAYVLTEASAYVLQDTELGMLYSSSYATWKDAIVSDHELLSAVLGPVAGSHVVGRTVLEKGFVRIDYANGFAVYVNYTSVPLSDGATEVPARSGRSVPTHG
jgi:hypothetical protein